MLKEIGKRYLVQELLGEGQQGEVYRVQGPEGIQALKLLKGASTQHLPALKREFSLLKSLHHPQILQLGDFAWDGATGRYFWTMEYVEGPLLNSKNPFSLKTLEQLFFQALQGLAYLHSQGVLHGDLKPGNLKCQALDDQSWQLKLLDFGLASTVQDQALGTPAYTAPEKILGEAADARSDLYSLALVFYEALTGAHPLAKDTLKETLQAQLSEKVPSATLKRPEIDPKLSQVLSALLEKNPRHRPQSAQEVLRDYFSQEKSAYPIPLPDLSALYLAGREDLFNQAKVWLDNLDPTQPQGSLVFLGESSLGGDRLLTELKYLAQLRSLPLNFVKSYQLENYLKTKKADLQKGAWVFSIKEAQLKKLASLHQNKALLLKLKALNIKELAKVLEKLNHAPIPKPLLESLWHYTQGAPVPIEKALKTLLKDPKILTPHGPWNLSPFKEVPPQAAQLGLDQKDSFLAKGLRPKELWELKLKQAGQKGSLGYPQEALEELFNLESEIKTVFKPQQQAGARAKLLEKKAWMEIKSNQAAKARESLAKALAHLEQSDLDKPVLELRLKNFLAYLDLQSGKLEEAAHGFESTLKDFKKLPEAKQIKVTNNELGQVFLAQGKLPQAIEAFEENLAFFKKIPENNLKMKAHYNLAEALTQNEEYEKASRHYESVVELARVGRHWAYLLRAYNGLGNLATRQKKRPRALDYYARALSLAEYEGELLSQASILQNLGVLFGEEQRYEEAIQALDKSQELLKQQEPTRYSRHLMARSLLELGEIYLMKSSLEAAKSCFSEALNRSKEHKSLRGFVFYPLLALAKLALREKNQSAWEKLLPELTHYAQSFEQKKQLNQLKNENLDFTSTQTSSFVEKKSQATPTFEKSALDSLLATHRALMDEKNPSELFEKILEYACELSGAESGLLLELSETGELTPLKSFNLPLDQALEAMSHQVAQSVLQSGKSLVTHNAQDDASFSQFESVISLQLKSIACLPIKYHQKLLGLLYLTHRHFRSLFKEETLNVLEAFALQAGLAIKNARDFELLKTQQAEVSLELNQARQYISDLQKNLREQLKNPYSEILGESPAMVEILSQVDVISDTPLSVLILGETGTGKEGLARAIHAHSSRATQNFVAINCSALPANLMESEVFGYKKGAFTGAERDKKGLLAEAKGGTLFLDEVAELPLEMQAKLLRVLQEKEFRPLGDTQAHKADFRLLTATHQDLEARVAEGTFREDLFYRLSQMQLKLPALRERAEDIPLLAKHFIKNASQEMSLDAAPQLNPSFLKVLMEYSWPGNVRELENLLKTATAFAMHGQLKLKSLPNFLKEKLKVKAPLENLVMEKGALSYNNSPSNKNLTWRQMEAIYLAKAYQESDGALKELALRLDLSLASVYKKIGTLKKSPNWQELINTSDRLPSGPLKEMKLQAIQQRAKKLGNASLAAKSLGLSVSTIYNALEA